jgi:hypothetical protein
MMPAVAVKLPVENVLAHLERIYGNEFYKAFESAHFPSPVQNENDCSWMRVANTVGINVRTLGDFWSVVPYAMTLPNAQNAIHLLPIFEPGVVSSLYGPTSWNINPEFFNPQLAALFPQLNTVEKQLSLTIRLLHLMGKAVGLDVIPHVDRYAEQVLANPGFFEWIQRKDMVIVQHEADVYVEVQSVLFDFLKKRGSVLPDVDFPEHASAFFLEMPETLRLRMMFGEPHEYAQRLALRVEMVDLLYAHGFETLPATMGPPYRGIEVDPDPNAKITDEAGRVWRDYRITKPEKFSRVFGPLARFKLYEPKDNNRHWELDFDRPSIPVWNYVCGYYKRIQAEFDFDFMRGDMSHVQMRPAGVPASETPYYDLLGEIKKAVLPEKPYFGYFAESFLAPPGEMAYGDECDHLEASLADSTLGDLQSEPIGTERFTQEFHRYSALLRTRKFAPNFCIMTADKDDPRFDAFYLNGNDTRYFIALFLTDMPSYMGLGFECRDPHPVPAPNEHYTKLYVFQVKEGPKSTHGPFVWGDNQALHAALVRQAQLAASILPGIQGVKTAWLMEPDASGVSKIIAWTQAENAKFVFWTNMDQATPATIFSPVFPAGQWELLFSSKSAEIQALNTPIDNLLLAPGECQVWKKH